MLGWGGGREPSKRRVMGQCEGILKARDEMLVNNKNTTLGGYINHSNVGKEDRVTPCDESLFTNGEFICWLAGFVNA